jgi:hypothetical protein
MNFGLLFKAFCFLRAATLPPPTGDVTQPFQGCDAIGRPPRVTRASQPWAEGCNPFGIGRRTRGATSALSHPHRPEPGSIRCYPEGIMSLSPGLRGTSYPGSGHRKGPSTLKGLKPGPGNLPISYSHRGAAATRAERGRSPSAAANSTVMLSSSRCRQSLARAADGDRPRSGVIGNPRGWRSLRRMAVQTSSADWQSALSQNGILRVVRLARTVEILEAQPVANRRYGRVPLCAT